MSVSVSLAVSTSTPTPTANTTSNNLTNTNITKKVKTNVSTPTDIIFGLPPKGDNNNEIEKSLPRSKFGVNGYDRILTLIPGDMQYAGSTSIINAWKFNPQVSEFNSKTLAPLLNNAGLPIVNIKNTGVKFYLREINFTDSISNQYGDNSLSSVNNMMSQLVGDYSYMANGSFDTFKNMMNDNLKAMLGESGASKIASLLGSTTNLLNEGAKKVGVDVGSFAKNHPVLADLVKGYKIDLPKIWKNSTNTKQLNCKITLQSVIDDVQAIKELILVPYTILLALSSPRSTKSYLYKWPYVIKMILPGYGTFKLSAITDVQITKGGADGLYSMSGKYLSIDISLTITPLYTTQFIAPDGDLPRAMLTVNDEVAELTKYFTKERNL